MIQLSTTDSTTADPAQREARDAIKRAWGDVPNLGAVLSLSLPMTKAVLSFDGALGKGLLRGGIAEQIAVAVSQENRCSYCLAAHSAAAGAYKVPAGDIADARTARASDPKTASALRFAQLVVRKRGHVDAIDIAEVRDAGWSDAAIVEIVGHAISTTLTNYLHHISDVPVDYPAVDFAANDEVVA